MIFCIIKHLMCCYLICSLQKLCVTGNLYDEDGTCDIIGDLFHVEDQKLAKEPDVQRSEKTMPSFLILQMSGISSSVLGVWSTADLPSRMLFGPMEGRVRVQNETHGYYGQNVWQLDHEYAVLDTTDQSESNWMRYVTTARHGGEANLKSVVNEEYLYFYSFKPIPKSTELSVWPGHVEKPSRSKKAMWSWNPLHDECCWPFFIKCKSRDCFSRTLQCEKPREVKPIHYCPECQNPYDADGECHISGRLNVIPDVPVSANGYDPDRAEKTLPPGFVIKKSSIKGAGLGVFAEDPIPSRTLLGPFEGDVYRDVTNVFADNGYAWMYLVDDSFVLVNGLDRSRSNWLRYVNTAPQHKQQNLKQFHCNGQVYYYTYRRIRRGEELFVWYGEVYDKHLNITRHPMTYNDRYDEIKWPFFFTCPKGNCIPTKCSLPPPCRKNDYTERCLGKFECDGKYQTNTCKFSGRLTEMKDTEVPRDRSVPDRAMKTLPPALEIRTSGIKVDRLGVFSREDIPSRTIFSAYEGVLVADPHDKRDNSYAWKILDKNSQPLFRIDGKDPSRSNWQRYVNVARSPQDVNVKITQCRHRLYYYTFKPVSAGQELQVEYRRGDESETRSRWTPFSWNRLVDETCWPFFHRHPKENRTKTCMTSQN